MKAIYLILSLLVVLSSVSCREELPQINPADQYSNNTYDQEFEAFWNGMNNNYLFWDIDPTDWDNVYRQYKPLFARLKIDTRDDLAFARRYYQEMTAQLVDSHYAMLFSDGKVISPAGNRVAKRAGYHLPISDNHYRQTVFNNYLDRNGMIGIPKDSSALLVTGKIKNTNILYFRFSKFNLKNWYADEVGSSRASIQYVLSELQKDNLDGMILDLRGNGGGAIADLNFLIGRLVDKSYVYGANRAKAGMGRLDYLPWVEASVYSSANAKIFTKPVVVLVDMHSVSMSEATAMAVKALPGGNGKVVGERTFGAMGAVTGNSNYNGGLFAANLGLVYASSMMFRYKDGVCYEGLGFPPDVEAPYDAAALKAGKDTQLETAIKQIR